MELIPEQIRIMNINNTFVSSCNAKVYLNMVDERAKKIYDRKLTQPQPHLSLQTQEWIWVCLRRSYIIRAHINLRTDDSNRKIRKRFLSYDLHIIQFT